MAAIGEITYEERKPIKTPRGERLCAVDDRVPHQGGNCFAPADYMASLASSRSE